MNYNDIFKDMEKHFSRSDKAKKRFIHSQGVVDMALKINKANNLQLDEEKIKIAGILHDYLKAYSKDEQIDILKRMKTEEELINYPSVIHSHIAPILLKDKYQLSDDICLAIRYHTTGHTNMMPLEKVIYVADAVEINRKYDDVEYFRNLSLNDLDRCLYEILEYTVNDLTNKNQPIHQDTIDAYNYYKKELKNGK